MPSSAAPYKIACSVFDKHPSWRCIYEASEALDPLKISEQNGNPSVYCLRPL